MSSEDILKEISRCVEISQDCEEEKVQAMQRVAAGALAAVLLIGTLLASLRSRAARQKAADDVFEKLMERLRNTSANTSEPVIQQEVFLAMNEVTAARQIFANFDFFEEQIEQSMQNELDKLMVSLQDTASGSSDIVIKIPSR